MNSHDDVRSFRPLSKDTRQISERCLVYEDPPKRFVFAQMTVGLKDFYARIRNENQEQNCFEDEMASEEVFSPTTGMILAGRYKVIVKVGEGQSSVVIQAEDIFHPEKKHVAIKILHASYQNLGPQEASCLLHLKKVDIFQVANISHVLNLFTVGKHFCIVFELLLSTPLYKYFKMFAFPTKADKINLIRRIAFQVIQCLAVLSSVNIIHADLKPENLLFTNEDKKDVKIIDFGNAIYWVHDEMSLYFDSFELQTVFYRAPEVMFGLPFGPQIDMWSLGCVLAELYLGEPIFLATSKDEILGKMQSLLGPLPMSPYQSGKYFSTFKKFVGRVSSVPGHSKNVVNILKKLGSTDYVFADFITRLLTLDPSLRISPVEAARHPFLASECAFGFILPHGYLTQESSYSPILLTPTTYTFRPKIDENIKKFHYSELELLRVGTKAKIKDVAEPADNVMKVLPFNFQKKTLSHENDTKRSEGGEEKEEIHATLGRDSQGPERYTSNVGPVVHGASVESIMNQTSSAKENNANNESRNASNCRKKTKSTTSSVNGGRSCDALNTSNRMSDKTEEKQFSLRTCPKNSVSGESSLTDKSKRLIMNDTEGQLKDALNTSHNVLNTTKPKSARLFIEQERDNESKDSCSVMKTFKNRSLTTKSARANRTRKDRSTKPNIVLNSEDTRSYTNCEADDRRDNAFNESCSIIKTFKLPRSTVESRTRMEYVDKRKRKVVLRKPMRTVRRRKTEYEESDSSLGRSSISTDDISDDSPAQYRKACASKSPVKFDDKISRIIVAQNEGNTTTKVGGVASEKTNNYNKPYVTSSTLSASVEDDLLQNVTNAEDSPEYSKVLTHNATYEVLSRKNKESNPHSSSPQKTNSEDRLDGSTKSNTSLFRNKKQPKTLRNLQNPNIESVFDSPSSIVSSTRELLPGGLSQVWKANCRSKKEHNNSVDHMPGSIRSSCKSDSEISEKITQTHTSMTNLLLKERNEKNSTEKDARLYEYENDEKVVSEVSTKEKPDGKEPELVENLTTDILTQDSSKPQVKPARKRKLLYDNTNSRRNKAESSLENAKGDNNVKIQKLPQVNVGMTEDDCENDILILLDDHSKRTKQPTSPDETWDDEEYDVVLL